MPTLTSAAFISFLYLMMALGLIYYYRKLEHVHLRTGAVAFLFACGAELLLYLSDVLSLPGLSVAAAASRFLFAACLFACLRQLASQGQSILFLIPATSAFAALSLTITLLDLDGRLENLLIELPGMTLMLLGVVSLLRAPYSVAARAMALLILAWVGMSAAIHVLGQGHLHPLDSMVALLLAGSMVVMSMESVMDRLSEREERITSFELEHRRLELQFAESKKLESLGALASGIAHDFNNMLTSIIGYTSLALRKLSPQSEVRKDLYMVMSGARQAAEMTSEMLAYAGKSPVEFETLDLSGVVDSMSGLVNSIVPRKIRLTHNVSRELPLVRGDSVQLGQVLMSLVANAIDAIEMEQGEIELKTGLRQLDQDRLNQCHFATEREPGVYVYISVSDSGTGIPRELQDRIFDPFYSGRSHKRGLGLASMSGIVRQHKGLIEVTSQQGSGSVFTVYLPAVAYLDAAAISSGLYHSGQAGARRTALLADDDPRIRGLIRALLESENYDVVEAEDGRAALEQLEKAESGYDLFVLDCTMPKKSGDEIYSKIRSGSIDSPVVMISGYNQEQVVADIGRDPNAIFLKKPFSIDELLDAVNSLNSRRQQPSPISPPGPVPD